MSTDASLLGAYAVDVYGEKRSDFDICLAALNDQADNVALVHSALDGLPEEMTENRHTQVLTAAYGALGRALDTMDAALNLLADCRHGSAHAEPDETAETLELGEAVR